MTIYKTLSNNLILMRKSHALSQEKLAELADLHPTYISGLERQKRNPSLQVLQKLADAFQISVSDLLSDSLDV